MQGVAPWRLKLQAVLVIAVGVIGAVAAGALTYFNFRNADLQSAYRAATACALPSDALAGEGCRYTADATVTGSSMSNYLTVSVTFDQLSGRTFTTAFGKGLEPPPELVATGSLVRAELWDGHVTRLAGVATSDDPDLLPGNFLPAAGIGAIVGALVIFWGVQFARKAWP